MANGWKNGWGRVVVVVLPFFIAGLVGFGIVKSEVSRNKEMLRDKANVETVNVQYQAVLREIRLLRDDVAELKVELRNRAASR